MTEDAEDGRDLGEDDATPGSIRKPSEFLEHM